MVYVCLYLLAAVLANLTISWLGPIATPFVAFLLIGLDITTRDKLHEKWASNHLWGKMFLLVAVGSLLSWLINPAAQNIALASGAAFAIAGLIDTIVYHLLRKKHKLIKINGSNIMSALADSLVFPTIAFGSLMPIIILSQWGAKVSGGFIWGLILFRKKRQKWSNSSDLKTKLSIK